MPTRKDVPTRELLASIYADTGSLRLTSVELGVSPQTVNNWLRSYDIPINPQGPHDGSKWRWKSGTGRTK